MEVAWSGFGWSFNSSLFNTSLDLSNYLTDLPSKFITRIQRLEELPSKFITRLQRLDELLSQDGPPHPLYAKTSPGMQMDGLLFQPVPAPWGFATSGYAIGLLAVALLLNRIQNIVVPPRIPTRPEPSRLTSPYLAPFWPIWSLLFPIDLSSTTCRLVFRIPSIYFLLKSLALWTVVLMQCTGFFPTSVSWSWVQMINIWGAKTEMQDLCWVTFGAVCLALCISALTRGLEGTGTENTAPFNLFGYAFLLHIYSSPSTHTINEGDLPSRPSKHVLIIIFLPLLQLCMIHILGVKKTWSRQRLIPTTICSLLSLIHFHSIFWTSPASYPILNYFPAFLESFLAIATILACGLNGLTQILLEGSITRPIFGHAESLAPKLDEDFSVVLLRLGTASLEATSVAGLGNEVGGISLPTGWLGDRDVYGDKYDPYTMELSRGGVSSSQRRRGKKGFSNEVKNIKAISHSTSGGFWTHSVWYIEFVRFWNAVWMVAKGFWRLIRSGSLTVPTSDHLHSPIDDDDSDDEFIRSSSISGDEVDFDDGSSSSSLSSIDASEVSHDEEEHDASIEVGANSSPIPEPSTAPHIRRRYRRHTAGSSDHDEGQSVPMEETGDFWTDYARDRRTAQNTAANSNANAQDEMWEESRRNCVVCTCQPRQIICWPCRCLALCDDCRENLASRSSASKHTCPCCRRSVDGFSRIYIP